MKKEWEESIESLKKSFEEEISTIETLSKIQELKVNYLGKKGPVQALLRFLKEVEGDEKKVAGKAINDLRDYVTACIDKKEAVLAEKASLERYSQEKIDLSLPGIRQRRGGKHILTKTMDRMIDILTSMGFSLQYGPDIETEYYNFDALNFPANHPAKDMQDTFYLEPGVLLRTHTSNIQAHVMEKSKPPIRIIAPGRVYRNETVSARSHVFFHQIEAVYIDKDVSLSDLLSTLELFFSKLFEKEVEVRVRPSYFPFVEPGIEVDIGCLACSGTGCGLCKHTGFLEVAGAGMIHPNVLKNSGIDPEEYTGFAWGLGVERLVLLSCGISDIRLFSENDVRFLQQFSS